MAASEGMCDINGTLNVNAGPWVALFVALNSTQLNVTLWHVLLG